MTAIEVLSPISKSWQGRQAYLDKRDKPHASRVNLVEIDLLLGGPPLPMKERIAPGAYYAIVAGGHNCRSPRSIAGPSVIRCRLSRFRCASPIPTLSSILRHLVDRAYNLGRHSRTLDHDTLPPGAIPLTTEDRAWIETLGGHGDHG